MSTKRLDDGVGIKTIERRGDRKSVEFRSKALGLVRLDTGTSSFVKPLQKPSPVLIKTFVHCGGISYRPKERAPLIANANHADKSLFNEFGRITCTRNPRLGSRQNFLSDYFQQNLHHRAQVSEMWIKS